MKNIVKDEPHLVSADYLQLWIDRAHKAEMTIKEIGELTRWHATSHALNGGQVSFSTEPDGEVVLYDELKALINGETP